MANVQKFTVDESLVGKFLISTPAIADNRFYKSVILITHHTANGSMGVVLNKPSAHTFFHILKSVNPDITADKQKLANNKINIVLGGPYNSNNLFIVHSNDYFAQETIKLNSYLSLTNQPKVVTDIATGNGPNKCFVAIGCCNWEAGQLEDELLGNDWVLFDDINESLFNYSGLDMAIMHFNFSKFLGVSNYSLYSFNSNYKIN